MVEPTSRLDPLFRDELMEVLLDFVKEKGRSVFLLHLLSLI